jgi:multisubunit Na+/H+ antiporter MnhC subunit
MPYSQQMGAIWWSLAVGIAFMAVIYLTIRSGWFRKAGNDVVPAEDSYPEPVEPVHHYPEGLAEAHGKVPPIVKAIIYGYIVFVVAYTALFLKAWNGPLAAIDAFFTK